MDEEDGPEIAHEAGRITIVWGLAADGAALHAVMVEPSSDEVPYIEAVGALGMAQATVRDMYMGEPE